MIKVTTQNLVDMAKDLMAARYQKAGHHSVVSAVVLTKSGHIYQAINTGTTQPSVATCAEIIAIGMANTAEINMQIDTIVAVRDIPSYVISPCGKCREYIADYSDDAIVVVPDIKNEYDLVPVSKLLPNKYAKKV